MTLIEIVQSILAEFAEPKSYAGRSIVEMHGVRATWDAERFRTQDHEKTERRLRAIAAQYWPDVSSDVALRRYLITTLDECFATSKGGTLILANDGFAVLP